LERSGYRARLRQGFGGQGRGDADIPTSIEAVIELLAEAGVMPERPLALLEAADEDPRAARLPILRRLMEFVLHHDGTVYLTRSRELAFLANTLARRILRSVAAVHATGSVRCGGVHLQSGSRMLACGLAGRDHPGRVVASGTRHGHAPTRSSWTTTS